MPLTIEQFAARKQAIEDNKQSLGLKKSGIDSNAAVTDIRSLYGSEPAAPGTQNPVTPAVPGAPAATTSPTIAEAAANIDVPDFNDPYQQFGDFYKSQFDTPVDEKAIRASTRERFQSEIDAINQIYAQKLAESKVQGQGRIGSSRSIQARSGLLGSDFGAAQTDTVTRYNTEIDNSVLAEQQAKIQAILTQADSDATAEITAKRTAKQQGAESYLAFLQGQTERKQKAVSGIVQTLFDKGIDPTRLDKATLDRITGNYGTDLGTLSAGYKALQQAQDDAEQAALDKEIGRTKSLAEIDKLTTETETGADKSRAETFLKLAEGRLKQLEVENYGQPPKPGTKDYAEYVKLLAETERISADIGNIGADTALKYANIDKIGTEMDKIRNEIRNRPELTPSQQNAAFKLTDNYEQASKDTRTITTAYNKITASANNPSAAGDLSLIFAYMKMLDPTSVVREGEFATAANAGSAYDQIGAMYNKVRSGERLTESQRADFIGRAGSIYKSAQDQQKIVDAEFSRKAQQYGIDPGYILSDLGSYNDRAEAYLTPLAGGQSYANPILSKYPYQEVEEFLAANPGVTELELIQSFQDAGVGLTNEGSDSNAQAVIGKAQPSPITLAVAKKYPVGSTGGQCTTFLHKIADFPPIGDGKNQKFASVDKIGIPKAQWQPRVGDIIVTDDNETYGHTMILTLILPGNKGQVTESNWKGNEKVTHSRIVNLSGSNIYGAIRPKQLKTTLA